MLYVAWTHAHNINLPPTYLRYNLYKLFTSKITLFDINIRKFIKNINSQNISKFDHNLFILKFSLNYN